jgi:hypothetical protein
MQAIQGLAQDMWLRMESEVLTAACSTFRYMLTLLLVACMTSLVINVL